MRNPFIFRGSHHHPYEMQRLRGSPSIVVLLFYFCCRLAEVIGLCPARCHCDDEVLQVLCETANLDVVPITLNPDLRELHLKNNHIKSIMTSFSVYHHLQYLDTSNNQLVTLGQRNFLFQKELKVLLVNRNMISSLDNETFRGLENLQVLHLNENFLGDFPDGVFSSLTKLEKLDLSRNRIAVLGNGAFSGLYNLRTLLLRDNKLERIPTRGFESVPNLLCLDLGLNYFRELVNAPFHPLTEMEELFLDGCGIRAVSVDALRGLGSLIKLKIHDNELETLPTSVFVDVQRLEELYIGQNLFGELEPGSFPHLKHLKTVVINGAKNFCRLHSGAFSENPNLERIVLNHNSQLRSIEPGAFAGLPNLRYVSLRANGFSTVDHSLLPWDEVEMLDVRDNPLVCNCSLLWLKMYLQSSNSTFHSEMVRVLCSEPSSLAGMPLVDLSTADLDCDADRAKRQIILGGVIAGAVAAAALVTLVFRFRDRFSRTLKAKWTSGRKEPQYQKTNCGEDENAMLPTSVSHHCVTPVELWICNHGVAPQN